MAMDRPNDDQQAGSADVGAAMIAWYADCMKEYPRGLVTQAQAASMLGISRMAVSRLVARGYLHAVYFPKPPDIEGIVTGYEDPTWRKILEWFGSGANASQFPKVVYVSFEDVVHLWQSGSTREKCQIDWTSLIFNALVPSKSEKQRDIEHYADRAKAQKGKPKDDE
jgi:hypothetical protein